MESACTSEPLCLPNAFICALSMLVRNNPECARVTERYLNRGESSGLIFPTVSHLHGMLRRHMAQQERTGSQQHQKTPPVRLLQPPPLQPQNQNGHKRMPVLPPAAGAGYRGAFVKAITDKRQQKNEMVEGYANAIRSDLHWTAVNGRTDGRRTKTRPPSLAEGGGGWQPFCLRRCPSGWRTPRSVTEAVGANAS